MEKEPLIREDNRTVAIPPKNIFHVLMRNEGWVSVCVCVRACVGHRRHAYENMRMRKGPTSSSSTGTTKTLKTDPTAQRTSIRLQVLQLRKRADRRRQCLELLVIVDPKFLQRREVPN